MTAEDHLRAGDLAAALAALQDRIRANAADVKLRIFLFQLLCVLGDWKRAVAQLKLCGEMSPEAVPMAQTYREAIICELFREKVFAGEKAPLFMGEPQEWLARLAEALRLLSQGRAAEAAQLRDLAFEAAPARPGRLNGEPFEWLADADMRLGPVLEVIVNGRYFWLPFSAVTRLEVTAPADLRDAVWMPANLTLANGGRVVALLPTRYPGTAAAGSDAEKLSRATGWRDAGAGGGDGDGDGTWIGLGQRLWSTESGEVALMDVRTLEFYGEGEGEGVAASDAASDAAPDTASDAAFGAEGGPAPAGNG